MLRCRERQWFCEVCDKRASGGAAKSKLARTECIGHPATALGQHARPQCHLLAQTGSYVWCCTCGARAAKFAKKLGEPCVGHPRSQEYARSIRLLSSFWHPKENRYLGSPKLCTKQAWTRWQQSYQGDNCDRAGSFELRQAVIRLRRAEAQPTNPDDKEAGRTRQCAKVVAEDCVQRRTSDQGV